MLQQALASRRVAINRSRLTVRDNVIRRDPSPAATVSPARVVLSWPYDTADVKLKPLPVPQVVGQSVREAALALHRRGFRVSLRGLGRVSRTVPPGGESALPGTAVAVWAE
jgi:hypothetical protein